MDPKLWQELSNAIEEYNELAHKPFTPSTLFLFLQAAQTLVDTAAALLEEHDNESCG